MRIRDRYRLSHQYRKGSLAILEVGLIVTLLAAVVACVFLSGDRLVTAIPLCAIYAAVPAAIYGYISINSQFVTPRFARLQVLKSKDRLVVRSPRLRWVITLGPWLVIMSAIFVLTFVESAAMSRWGDRPTFIQVVSGIAVLLLIPFARSRQTVIISSRVAEGVVFWGPMEASYRTDPIESLEIGVQSGIRGKGSIERKWFGSRSGRRSEFNPALDLIVLNNAYSPLTLSDITIIAGVEAKVGK